MRWDDVLDTESNYHKRLISESIYIKTQENDLNIVEDIEPLNSIYFPLLDRLKLTTSFILINFHIGCSCLFLFVVSHFKQQALYLYLDRVIYTYIRHDTSVPISVSK